MSNRIDKVYIGLKIDHHQTDRAGFDTEEFARLKAMASDSLTRLLGNASLTSSTDIDSLKSLSNELYLWAPYSPNSKATPALSDIKMP